MKKILTILTLSTLVACTSDTGEADNGEIKPQAGFVTTHTRADLSEGPISGTTFPASTTNLFAVYAYPYSDTPSYTTPAFANISVDSDNNAALSFNPSQFYPINGDALLFYAYSPVLNSDKITAGSGSTEPIASYTLTGKQDIMAASAVGVNNKGFAKMPTGQVHPSFAFTHKLTQLKFKVKAATSFTSSIPVAVTKIVISSQETTPKLNLITGALSWDASATSDIVAYDNATGITIGSDYSNEFGITMLKPQAANASYNLIVTAGGITYSAATITIAGGTPAGQATTIQLTFDATEILPAATITDWVNNATVGNVTIQ